MDEFPLIYAISDSIGETIERVAKAAVSQFVGKIEIRRVGSVDTEEKIKALFKEILAHDKPVLVCHTLVSPGLRETLLKSATTFGIPTVDVMGPVLGAVQKFSGYEPQLKPGLVHKLDRDYFERIKAVEFAVRYDDGKDTRGILEADIVLVGISRTSKTPLSMYLAYRKIKVANVPVVPEVPPPPELFKVHSQRVIGLVIDPFKLNEIRHERLKVMGMSLDSNYATLDRIEAELSYALEIMRKLHCLVIDVSNLAIEETANSILELAKKNHLLPQE